jgi:putative DNA primase/helicase
LLKKLYKFGTDEDHALQFCLEMNENFEPKDERGKIEAHVQQTYQQLREEKKIIPTKQQELTPIPAWELAKREFGERRWIARGLIPHAGITFLAGKKGVKKTFTALELALCVAEGKPLFGVYPTELRHVLFLDAEGGEYTCWERLNKLRKEIPKDFYLSFYPKLCLNEAEGGPLEEYLSAHPNCLVIIDALRRVLEVDENDAKEINDVFMPLKRFCEKYGASFVIIHHLRKVMIGRFNDDQSDEMRGSSDLGNIADSVLIIEKVKDSPNALILKQAKNRVGVEASPSRIELNENENGLLSFVYIGEWEESLIQQEKAGKALLEWAYLTKKKEFETKEAIEELKNKGFGSKTTSRALSDLVKGNRIVKSKRGHYLIPSGTLTDYPPDVEELGTTGQKGQDKGLGGDGSA